MQRAPRSDGRRSRARHYIPRANAVVSQRRQRTLFERKWAGGAIFSKSLAGRGLALGDFDNDGSVDVLVTVNNGAPVLLRNLAGKQNHWLGLKLVGKTANIDAVGARITYQAGSLKRSVYKAGGGSYLSSHDPRVVLGLGHNVKIDLVEISWPNPSGKIERFVNLPIDRYVTIVEGQNQWR